MRLKIFAISALLAVTTAAKASAAAVYSTGFEAPTHTTGDVNGQDGWSTTGTSEAVVVRDDVTSFGDQSVAVSFNFKSGLASATRNRVQIASGLAFNSANARSG